MEIVAADGNIHESAEKRFEKATSAIGDQEVIELNTSFPGKGGWRLRYVASLGP